MIMGKIRKHRRCFCRTSFFCKQQVKFAAAGKREKKIYSVKGDCNDNQNKETDIAGNDHGWIEKIRNGTEYRRCDQTGNRLSYAEGHAVQGLCKGGCVRSA